jgi:PIN domain nuclease of toxin-antitoxin system
MRRILLDTHVFLWLLIGDPRLSARACSVLRDPSHQVFLSVASLWEILVKHQIGKLPLPAPPEIYVPAQRDRHRIASLDIDEGSVLELASLPQLHRDPFDRLLICQARRHGLEIATLDDAIRAYPVALLDMS